MSVFPAESIWIAKNQCIAAYIDYFLTTAPHLPNSQINYMIRLSAAKTMEEASLVGAFSYNYIFVTFWTG